MAAAYEGVHVITHSSRCVRLRCQGGLMKCCQLFNVVTKSAVAAREPQIIAAAKIVIYGFLSMIQKLYFYVVQLLVY